MSQSPPAFQEYAANILSQLPFRGLCPAGRGLYYTLKLELWVNRRLPRNPGLLANILGWPPDEIAKLLPAVMKLFEVDGEDFFSREHEDYRAVLNDRRERQSKGGKRSSEARNGKRKSSVSRMDKGAASTLPSTLQVPRQGTGKSFSTEQHKTEQHSQEQSLSGAVVLDDFVADMNRYEETSAAAYLKAKQG